MQRILKHFLLVGIWDSTVPTCIPSCLPEAKNFIGPTANAVLNAATSAVVCATSNSQLILPNIVITNAACFLLGAAINCAMQGGTPEEIVAICIKNSANSALATGCPVVGFLLSDKNLIVAIACNVAANAANCAFNKYYDKQCKDQIEENLTPNQVRQVLRAMGFEVSEETGSGLPAEMAPPGQQAMQNQPAEQAMQNQPAEEVIGRPLQEEMRNQPATGMPPQEGGVPRLTQGVTSVGYPNSVVIGLAVTQATGGNQEQPNRV